MLRRVRQTGVLSHWGGSADLLGLLAWNMHMAIMPGCCCVCVCVWGGDDMGGGAEKGILHEQ